MASSELDRRRIQFGYIFLIDGPRVNKRDTPYLLRSLDMSDDDLDMLVDGQSSGKIAKERKRAKSSDRSRKTTTEMFHTPGLTIQRKRRAGGDWDGFIASTATNVGINDADATGR